MAAAPAVAVSTSPPTLAMEIGAQSRSSSGDEALPPPSGDDGGSSVMTLDKIPDALLDLIVTKLDRKCLSNLSGVSSRFSRHISPLALNDLPAELLLAILK